MKTKKTIGIIEKSLSVPTFYNKECQDEWLQGATKTELAKELKICREWATHFSGKPKGKELFNYFTERIANINLIIEINIRKAKNQKNENFKEARL